MNPLLLCISGFHRGNEIYPDTTVTAACPQSEEGHHCRSALAVRLGLACTRERAMYGCSASGRAVDFQWSARGRSWILDTMQDSRGAFLGL